MNQLRLQLLKALSVALILGAVGASATSAHAQMLPRYDGPFATQAVLVNSTRLSLPRGKTEAFLLDPVGDELSPEKAAHVLKLTRFTEIFSRITYPRFVSALGIQGDLPVITILFHEFTGDDLHRGMFRPEYLSEHGLNAIAVDSRVESESEFNLIAIHELQHLFNRRAKTDAMSEDTWLDEGLSRYLEVAVTGAVPVQAIDTAFFNGRLPPLTEWASEPEPTEAREARYTHAYLFVHYLAKHFGGIKLIRDLVFSPTPVGIEGLSARLSAHAPASFEEHQGFLSIESVFTNFSIALVLNTRKQGFEKLLSLSGADFSPAFDGRALKPKFLGTGETAVYLAPYENRAFSLMPNQCTDIGVPEDVRAYLIAPAERGLHRITQLEQLDARSRQKTCTDHNVATLLYVRTK